MGVIKLHAYPMFILAFILGMKHAIEPDHIIAMSTIICKEKNVSKAAILGALWGIGHTVTLFVIGMIGIMTKHKIPENLAVLLERSVGIMIIILAIKLLVNYKKPLSSHAHDHIHNHMDIHHHPYENDHTYQAKHATGGLDVSNMMQYTKSLLIGLVHGLAGGAAMILLTLSTVKSYWEGALFIIIFGIGTIFSMLVFAMIFGIPFALNHRDRIYKYMNIFIGIIGIAFGLGYLFS